MNVIEPKYLDVFHYADMAKTIDYQWWTYGPVQCVGPNFLAMAMNSAGWEFHHLKPLFDSAKSLVANPDPLPLKRGNRKWKRVIIVDGLTIYMGVHLFNMVCKEYHLDPKKELVTEKQFLQTFKKVYPNVRVHYGVEDYGVEDYDEIWVCAVGYWDANRILYSPTNQEIRMWRNYGRYDYRFKSITEFEDWLINARNHERQFETNKE